MQPDWVAVGIRQLEVREDLADCRANLAVVRLRHGISNLPTPKPLPRDLTMKFGIVRALREIQALWQTMLREVEHA